MPGLVKNHDHAAKLNDSDFMQDIKKIINDAGVMVLSDTWLAGGFSSKKNCILEPDDIKGQVTRAAGKAFEQMMAGAGASIASMPSSEIYTAMQTGQHQFRQLCVISHLRAGQMPDCSRRARPVVHVRTDLDVQKGF